jgi:ribonucleoside-diphosphate reductase alpha chain
MRRVLPRRRAAETFNLRFWNQSFSVTIGFYPDGTPGEVFIDGGKTGQDIQSTARDAAVVLSLALQHGVSPETIRHAVTRGASEGPASILGAVVDFITTKSFSGGV